MDLTIYQVDAFASEVFAGNPAAIVPLDTWLPDEVMQKIAMENNLSETAFFVKEGEHYHLRWFTPSMEIDLCGHATLASAYVLFSELGYDRETITFNSRSGLLHVHKRSNGLMMDFPVWEYKDIEPSPALIDALGAPPKAVYKGIDWIALYEDEASVRALEPNMDGLKNIPDMRGILPTAPGEKTDFVSRFFAPAVGVPEDPVTGSAHCILTPFWAERLGKDTLSAHQASSRGGDLLCELKGDRVQITGEAVLYMRGTIYV